MRIEEEIQAVIDHQKITAALYRYCRAGDRLDRDLFESVFWPDARCDAVPDGVTGAQIPDLLASDMARRMFVSSMHCLSTINIELNGDRAFAESYVLGIHVSHPSQESRVAMIGAAANSAAKYAPDATIECLLAARYLDLFEKRDGEWRIFERRYIPEWIQHQLYRSNGSGGFFDMLRRRGSRDRLDPSYWNS